MPMSRFVVAVMFLVMRFPLARMVVCAILGGNRRRTESDCADQDERPQPN